jgi:carbon storage regulator
LLVISRRVGERFLIGDNILISITGIDRGQVRIGIEAPPEVRIMREELLPERHFADGEGEL